MKCHRFLKDYFRYHGTASSISPDVYFIACELTQDFYRHFVLVVVMPAFFVVTFAIVSAVQAYYLYRQQAMLTKGEEELRLAAYREEVLDRDGCAVVGIASAADNPLTSPLKRPKRTTAFVGIAARMSVVSDGSAASPLSTSEDADTNKPATAATSVEREPAPSFVEELLNRLSVSIVVILFLLFPPIVQACTRMLTCEDLDYGDRGVKARADGGPVD